MNKNNNDIKILKPTSPGCRHVKKLIRSEVTYRGRPEFKLINKKHKSKFGINNLGRNTDRTNKSPSNKRFFRIIDWKRTKTLEGKVVRIEIDPNRSSNIALIQYNDGSKSYILAPVDLKVGNVIIRSNDAKILPGNAMELRFIPVGTFVHCLETQPYKGASVARSAGSYGKILSQEGNYTKVELSSKEVKLFFGKCLATIGIVGNISWNKQNLGKAGKMLSIGVRPTVRGCVMNPVDHPHGGGEGKQKIGRKSPVNKNGLPMFGLTRQKNKITNKFIVKKARLVRANKK